MKWPASLISATLELSTLEPTTDMDFDHAGSATIDGKDVVEHDDELVPVSVGRRPRTDGCREHEHRDCGRGDPNNCPHSSLPSFSVG